MIKTEELKRLEKELEEKEREVKSVIFDQHLTIFIQYKERINAKKIEIQSLLVSA